MVLLCVCASPTRTRRTNARGTFLASDTPRHRELVRHLLALGYAPQNEAGLQEARCLIAGGEMLDRKRGRCLIVGAFVLISDTKNGRPFGGKNFLSFSQIICQHPT